MPYACKVDGMCCAFTSCITIGFVAVHPNECESFIHFDRTITIGFVAVHPNECNIFIEFFIL
jgi:hypothetical protein